MAIKHLEEIFEVTFKASLDHLHIEDDSRSFRNIEDALSFAKKQQGPVKVTKVTKEIIYGKN